MFGLLKKKKKKSMSILEVVLLLNMKEKDTQLLLPEDFVHAC